MKKYLTCCLFCLGLSSCVFLARPSQNRHRGSAPDFHPPLQKYVVTQKFKARHNPPHLGLDLKAPYGAPVFSAHRGRVIYAGRRLSGYGLTVVLEHPLGQWASLYAHLRGIAVKSGEIIPQGFFIGTVGQTGRATGPHLHFELLRDKKAVDPLLYLPSLGR